MNKNTLLSGVQRFPVNPSSLIGQYTKLNAILFLVKKNTTTTNTTSFKIHQSFFTRRLKSMSKKNEFFTLWKFLISHLMSFSVYALLLEKDFNLLFAYDVFFCKRSLIYL